MPVLVLLIQPAEFRTVGDENADALALADTLDGSTIRDAAGNIRITDRYAKPSRTTPRGQYLKFCHCLVMAPLIVELLTKIPVARPKVEDANPLIVPLFRMSPLMLELFRLMPFAFRT